MDGVIQLLETAKDNGKTATVESEGVIYTKYKVTIGKSKYYGALLPGLNANDAITFKFTEKDGFSVLTSVVKDNTEYAFNVLEEKINEEGKAQSVKEEQQEKECDIKTLFSTGEKIEVLKAAILTHSVPGGELNEEKVIETYNNYLKLF